MIIILFFFLLNMHTEEMILFANDISLNIFILFNETDVINLTLQTRLIESTAQKSQQNRNVTEHGSQALRQTGSSLGSSLVLKFIRLQAIASLVFNFFKKAQLN